MKKILVILMFCILALAPMSSFAATGQALADVGADFILGQAFHGDTQVDFYLKLYCTDISPADTDIYSTYTWCTGGGYADISLTRATSTITVADDPSDVVWAQKDFAFTGGLTTNTTIYGYCITNAANTILIGCEALASTFTPANGYHLYITPKIKLSKGTAN